MSTRVSCLTPAGSGAIATIAVHGPEAWTIARCLFHPTKRELPELPSPGSTWFGTLGRDEVILAVPSVEPEPTIEIHCHGGRQIVRMLIDLFRAEGCEEATESLHGNSAWSLLPHAKTLRTAAILLDQANGAFERALQAIRDDLEHLRNAEAIASIEQLHRLVPLGRHLLTPWRVVIAGPPNAGKSSLLNALAGYQRSIVAPVPGTTRDVVTATLAFDGWLVELSDTAGLREACDLLEQEGIERTRASIADADLCMWVIDATEKNAAEPDATIPADRVLPVLNKIDLVAAPLKSDALGVSAAIGAGLDRLVEKVVSRLVSHSPSDGDAVPYSVEMCELIETLQRLADEGRFDEIKALIQASRLP
ncbi:MAG: 50S ribosome-binding GTPase [Planctomycetes bacterium]|nr:50S ribosome-binding GTPase [Planctomycetota bacterium]